MRDNGLYISIYWVYSSLIKERGYIYNRDIIVTKEYINNIILERYRVYIPKKQFV